MAHLPYFNLLDSCFSFFGSSFIRKKENGNVGGYFLYCFQTTHRGFKGKVDLNKKLAQKYTSVST